MLDEVQPADNRKSKALSGDHVMDLNDVKDDHKIHSVVRIGQKYLIEIDEKLVLQLSIQDGDTISQVVEGKTIRLVLHPKNRSAGPSFQTNPAQDSVVRLPTSCIIYAD